MQERPSPTISLIPDACALLGLAIQALSKVREEPDDILSVLSCFLFTLHLKDYAGLKRPQLKDQCPFWETIEEVANGTKHLTQDAKRYPEPHVQKVAQIGAYGAGAYGAGPYGRSYIGLITRRASTQKEQWFSADTILAEALTWWTNRLNEEKPK